MTELDTSAIEEEITNIVVELYDTISLFKNNDDLETVYSYIESYIKRVTIIGFRLKKSKFTALRDSCVIFHEILEDLKNRSTLLSNEQLQQFEVWPTLILAYLSEPENKINSKMIVDLISDDIWPYQINRSELMILKDDFNIAVKDELPDGKEDEEETSGAFDGALFIAVQEEVVEAMSGLLSDLASTEDDDDFSLGHAFSLCADRIELLGMSIASAGLMGLMDVCVIFQTGLRELARREKPLNEDENLIIEEWTSHFIAYLSYPTDHEIVDQLVDYLNKLPWSESMSEEEMVTLRFMLIPEDIVVTAPIPIEEEQEEIHNQEQKLENELNYEMDDTDGLDEISVSEDQYYLGQELIQLIKDEFELEKSSLDDAIKNISQDKTLDENNIEELTKFKVMIERFSLATESIGLTGLNKILVHLVGNLVNIITNKQVLSESIVVAFKNLPEQALNYLNKMDDSELINTLITPYFSSSWPIIFTYDQSLLEKEMLSPKLMIEDDIEIRATQATIEDVSLTLPDDVNQQLLSTLLQELPIQTEAFTESITHIVDGNASLKDVEKAQRIAHTLKGAANTVGVVGIATLTHHIEDIFNAFTDQNRLPGKNLADILMNAADVLEMMSEALLGQGEEPQQAQATLQQILDWANLIDQDGIPEDDEKIEIQETPSTENSQTENNDTSHLSEIIAPTMLRVPATLMDELLRIAGESIILGGQLQERLRKANEQTKFVHEQNSLYQQLVFELEQIVDMQGLSTNNINTKKDDVFDTLELEQYNELHTVTHRLVEAATDSKELTLNIEDELNTLENLLVDQSHLHKENQNIVMQTRMVPIQNIVPRLQRSIRQTSRTTSKKVILNIEGAETLMDSDVLDELIDPMMHLLRNAIDHGIENELIREKKKKPSSGIINLSFLRDGDHIVVRCIDDGSGLDFDEIKRTAIKKKLIKQDEETSKEELIRLIWLAGFTTRNTTTQVSGRGIGMDAVYNKISAMKGTINIASEKDKGCTVEIRLPLTLISVHAILIKLRKQTIAVSNRGIEQILCPGDGELKRDNDKYCFHYNDEVFTAFDIETLLHQPRDQRNTDREDRTVFILRDETGYQYAIAVEQVIANQDLIVKQLGEFIPDIMGIDGATILGDGSVAPVLDLPGLIRTLSKNDISLQYDDGTSKEDVVIKNISALIVDDSLSARRSLAEFVKDLGYEVRMARDGIEAIEQVKVKKPDIILVDLEMPRMNGLEMTSHLRSKSVTKDIPVIMITSRSTEKHRDMADSSGVDVYLTKPFAEDELLESIQNLLLAVH